MKVAYLVIFIVACLGLIFWLLSVSIDAGTETFSKFYSTLEDAEQRALVVGGVAGFVGGMIASWFLK
jgi:hypothetical protein